MGKGVNKVIIVGNVGADPEARYMPSGGAITTISVATSDEWTDKNTGQKQKRTEWHRITMFNRLGEIAAQYITKGSQVYIEGSIRTEKYKDKNTGEDRYSTQIIANNMQMLGGGQERDNSAPAQPASRPPPAKKPPPDNRTHDTPPEGSFGDFFDDDIPF